MALRPLLYAFFRLIMHVMTDVTYTLTHTQTRTMKNVHKSNETQKQFQKLIWLRRISEEKEQQRSASWTSARIERSENIKVRNVSDWTAARTMFLFDCWINKLISACNFHVVGCPLTHIPVMALGQRESYLSCASSTLCAPLAHELKDKTKPRQRVENAKNGRERFNEREKIPRTQWTQHMTTTSQ